MEELPPLPTLPITSEATLRKCRHLPVGSKDIFVCSFPKSGTTWMQNIVYQLVSADRRLSATRRRLTCTTNKNEENLSKKEGTTVVLAEEEEELPFDHISQYAPFYEIDPHWDDDDDHPDESSSSPILIDKIRTAHKALGYRIFNTHLRWDMLPQEGDGAKYIYVVRDGRDVLTSFYHHLSNQHPDDGGFTGDFEDFFHQFLNGTIAYGKWSHHLASWMPRIIVSDDDDGGAAPAKEEEEEGDVLKTKKQQHNHQILLVRYEDLQQDLRHQVIRIAKFLQLDSFCPVNKDKDDTTTTTTGQNNNQLLVLDRVLERVSFEWMREHQQLFHPVSVRWAPGYNFIRTGRVGDHGTIFDEQHRKKFMESVISDFGGKEHVPGWLHEYCFHDEA